MVERNVDFPVTIIETANEFGSLDSLTQAMARHSIAQSQLIDSARNLQQAKADLLHAAMQTEQPCHVAVPNPLSRLAEIFLEPLPAPQD